MIFCYGVQVGERIRTIEVDGDYITIEDNNETRKPIGTENIELIEGIGCKVVYMYFIGKDGIRELPPEVYDIFVGLIRQYVQAQRGKKAYLTTKEFVQGIGLLGWKTNSKLEIINNYVTAKPTFKVEDEIVEFSHFLIEFACSLTKANPMAA